MDDIVCGPVDRLDWRVHRVPRSRRADQLVAVFPVISLILHFELGKRTA